MGVLGLWSGSTMCLVAQRLQLDLHLDSDIHRIVITGIGRGIGAVLASESFRGRGWGPYWRRGVAPAHPVIKGADKHVVQGPWH